MKKYYVSSFDNHSGISRYARDFHRLVLKSREYIHVDSLQSIPSILSLITSRDHVHIELGVFQKKEIELLVRMLKAKYRSVAVTLHDAPLVKYPYFDFKSPVLNHISKIMDIGFNSFGIPNGLIRNIRSIYVLTQSGVCAVKNKYQVDQVHYLPHVVDPKELNYKTHQESGPHFLFFGFIGINKGIEYALSLHEKILETSPDLNFYVIGKPLGKAYRYYDSLRKRYRKNVQYLGFVPDEELDAIFDKTTFAILPFKSYRFYRPFSGSILQGMKKGKIILTRQVNAIPELIQHGKNGIFLTGNMKKDIKTIQNLSENPALRQQIRAGCLNYLLEHHSPEVVSDHFFD